MNGIIFIGLQGSGKSSFYVEQFYHTHMRLNQDMLKTRHREILLFHACLSAKQPLVLDNTNPTREGRARYIRELKAHRFEVIGYYFNSVLEDCLARNARRSGHAHIPEVAIKATYAQLERPHYSEGFDKLYYVTLEQQHFSVKEWNDDLP